MAVSFSVRSLQLDEDGERAGFGGRGLEPDVGAELSPSVVAALTRLETTNALVEESNERARM